MGQHLGVDFDTEDGRSSLQQLKKDLFIAKYGALLYTTPSHTPDKPRARVIFLLDTPIIQPTNYVLASSALLWIFGSGDRQCKDACRFFYGGRPGACEMEWVGNELSLGLIKDLIKRYQETGLQARKQLKQQYEPCNVSEREVMNALKFIDPWGVGEYGDWLDILFAIHSEFPGDNGLAMAESWAQGYDGEVARKWKSFHTNGSVTGRIGIGTLFQKAKERGWVKL
jgi:hypothetical protein